MVLYWTRAWWSGVDDERVEEGKRLIFPGLRSRLSCSRESARNIYRERDRDRDKKREKERKEGRKTVVETSSDRAKVF